MTNRNPVKQLFITFPKSNIDKSEFRDLLLRFEPDYYKICEEKHQDGTPHLHAVIRFKNKYSKAIVLKYFENKLPLDYRRIDIQPVRSIKKALLYLSKEDSEPLESGEFIENRNPQLNLMKHHMDLLAQSAGYADHAQAQIQQEQDEVRNQKILDIWHEHKMIYHDKEDHRTKIILKKLLLNNFVQKDDITYFKNYWGIKV